MWRRKAPSRGCTSSPRLATRRKRRRPGVATRQLLIRSALERTVRILLQTSERRSEEVVDLEDREAPHEERSTLGARGLVKEFRKRRVVNEVDLHVSQGE